MNLYYYWMTDTQEEAGIRVWTRLVRAKDMAMAGVERALKRASLPPLAWYDVLLELERAGDEGLRPYELERAMLLAQYNLSRLIDRIEAAGYVKRQACQEDGRGQRVLITPAGRSLRQTMWPIYRQAIHDHVTRHISGEEASLLASALEKLISDPN